MLLMYLPLVVLISIVVFIWYKKGKEDIQYCPKAEIWAYGSRISDDFHPGSDLDLTVVSFNDNNKNILHLKNLLNESDIPFLIDITEFDRFSESFQKEIKLNYIKIFPLKNL